jgi:hypothetical protein
MYESGTHELYAVRFPDGTFAKRAESAKPSGGVYVTWSDDEGEHSACAWDGEQIAQGIAEAYEYRAQTMGAAGYATSVVKVFVNIEITTDVRGVPLAIDGGVLDAEVV